MPNLIDLSLNPWTCGNVSISRRAFCRLGSLAALGWYSSRALALAEQQPRSTRPAVKSLILLWMGGGPSQLETFDPHPGSSIGGPTKAIDTTVKGIQIADKLPRIAGQMDSIALIRSMVTKEGDHDRGRYLVKTGYRPNPSVVHPSIGAICARHLSAEHLAIPPYISILANDRHSRGGYLGESFDPFRMDDPRSPVPDTKAPVSPERRRQRADSLAVVENALRQRNPKLEARTLHNEQIRRALAMMDSTQLAAFDIRQETVATRSSYGDSAFGRGCLAARRLVEAGVRCVEVELTGWDTHANNFEGHNEQNEKLDPAFAALVADLKERDLLETTLVVCTGEFGRTPKVNPLGGRDHWTTGFSIALAGGGVRGGIVLGATDPEGKKDPTDPCSIEDFYATVLHTLGVDPAFEHLTSIGRPIKLAEGKPIPTLLKA